MAVKEKDLVAPSVAQGGENNPTPIAPSVKDIIKKVHKDFGQTGMSWRELQTLMKAAVRVEIERSNPEVASRLETELAAEFSSDDSTTFSQN